MDASRVFADARAGYKLISAVFRSEARMHPKKQVKDPGREQRFLVARGPWDKYWEDSEILLSE